jgi:hypothetical protein
MGDVKTKNLNGKQVPRGTYDFINNMYNDPRLTPALIKKYKINPIELWRATVITNFDTVMTEETERIRLQPEATTSRSSTQIKEVRSIIVPVKSILRPQLENFADEFIKKFLLQISQLQEQASDFILQFSTVVEIFMLLFVNSGPLNTQTLNDLFPPGFLHDDYIKNESLSPLPKDVSSLDQRNLFNFSHLQYIGTCNFSKGKGIQEYDHKNIIWNILQKEFDNSASLSDAITNINAIMPTVRGNCLSKFQTNLDNMWKVQQIIKKA